MPLKYNVPESKHLRIIIDTDAACEADDPFAIAHALMCKKFEVKAILAEHFALPGSMQKSYDEIMTVLEAMELSARVFKGEEAGLAELDPAQTSEAAQCVIDEANKKDPKPLFILCMGAITNIATAIRKDPGIAKKMTVIWIGGHDLNNKKPDHREFNSGNDVAGYNLVVSSGVEFWQVPNNVYGTMHIGIAEIQNRISPCGKIGKHLFEYLVKYNESKYADWTSGESWSLGDSPTVGLALEPNCGGYIYQEAPILNEDTSYSFKKGRPLIRVYTSINSRFILEDFISKLQLLYGSNEL